MLQIFLYFGLPLLFEAALIGWREHFGSQLCVGRIYKDETDTNEKICSWAIQRDQSHLCAWLIRPAKCTGVDIFEGPLAAIRVNIHIRNFADTCFISVPSFNYLAYSWKKLWIFLILRHLFSCWGFLLEFGWVHFVLQLRIGRLYEDEPDTVGNMCCMQF